MQAFNPRRVYDNRVVRITVLYGTVAVKFGTRRPPSIDGFSNDGTQPITVGRPIRVDPTVWFGVS